MWERSHGFGFANRAAGHGPIRVVAAKNFAARRHRRGPYEITSMFISACGGSINWLAGTALRVQAQSSLVAIAMDAIQGNGVHIPS